MSIYDRWIESNPVLIKFYLYHATTSFGFTWPIFTLFQLDRGLSFTQIALLSSLSAVITGIAEIPTGYVGDWFGRRNTMIIGMISFTVATFGFAFSHSFAAFAIMFVFWGLAHTFQSGSVNAWLYDTLKAETGEDQFTRINGRAQSIKQVVTLVAMGGSGVLFEYHKTLPFITEGMLHLCGVLILFSLPQTPSYKPDGAGERFTIRMAVSLIRDQLTIPPLRSVILYLALFTGAVRAVQDYVQPVSTTILGIPIESMGLLYAGFSVMAAIASYKAPTIENYVGTRWSIRVIPIIVGILFIAPIFSPIIALGMFFTLQSSEALLGPITGQYLNDHIESTGRATVLSATSMVKNLAQLPFYLLGGIIADQYSPLVAITVVGGIFLLGSVSLFAVEPPVTHH